MVVSGLPGALYSIYCLGVSTILESEKIATMWHTNDKIAPTRKGSRGVGGRGGGSTLKGQYIERTEMFKVAQAQNFASQ